MDFRFTNTEGINDCIQGAVISHTQMTDDGATLYLEDGRAIVFPDCPYFAVIYSHGIVQ